MSFRPRRALAVFWKDFLDLRKNRGLLGSMAVIPCVMVLVPTLMVWAYVRNPDDPSLRVMARYYEVSVQSADAARFLIDKSLTDWFGLFLIMPLFIPILISSSSVAGEKERRTLEPLLASPATSLEIVVGKSLAALLPAVLVSFAAFVLFCISVDVVAWKLVRGPLLPNGMWIFGVVVIAPLFAFLGNGVAILISARVGDSRLAQQLSGLVSLPILGMVGSQVAGVLRAGAGYYAIVGAVVLLLDLLLLRATIRLFDRERLISRWS
ncbi:MAG: ABC transporter permease [Myxococcaceae bacterium]|nr:ABC transporter permease [Myxococcaceae bacterium]